MLPYLLPYPLMMCGMYLLLRRRLGRRDAALFGGLLLVLCCFNLLQTFRPNAIAVVAFIPWQLWAINVAMGDSRRFRVALACSLIAIFTGSQLLLNCPPFAWLSLFIELSYVVFLKTARKYTALANCELCASCDYCIGCTVETWPRVVIAKGIGLLIGASQVLPSLDAWLRTDWTAAPKNSPFLESLHPLNVLQLLAPYMFAGREIGENTGDFSLYIGAVPLILIVLLAARWREIGQLTPLVKWLAAFAVLAVFCTFGKYGLVYYFVALTPGLREISTPAGFTIPFQFTAVILASVGFLILARQCEASRKHNTDAAIQPTKNRGLLLWRDFEPIWCAVGLSLAAAAIGLALCHEPCIASLPNILAGPALITLAAVLTVLAGRGKRAALAALIILAVLDLGYYGATSPLRSQKQPNAYYSTKTPLPAWETQKINPESPANGQALSCIGLSLLAICFLNSAVWPKPRQFDELSP